MDQISLLKTELEKVKSKTFNVYFFTVDTKGTPSGYISYIYNTARELINLGYKVHMLHQESEFIGVSSWMGDEFAQIPHHNIEKEKIALSVSDVLFIPELFSNVMSTTQKVPCKRVVILQNFDYLTQIIPAGISWMNYGIKDCVTTTSELGEKVKSVFPFVNNRVVSPLVDETLFNEPIEPKKLIVNMRHDYDRNTDVIVISNSISDTNIDIDKIFEKNYSTKKEPSGFGLYEVKKFLKHNPQAYIVTSIDKSEKLFTQTLTIESIKNNIYLKESTVA